MKQIPLLLALLFAVPLAANEISPLPDPLSLQQALSLIDESHPELMQAGLDKQYSEVDLLDATARNNFRVDLDGRLRWTEPSSSNPTRDDDDHRLSLIVSKPLYDGGLTTARQEAARLAGLSADIDYEYLKKQYSIKVMQDFFNIILADLRAARDIEALATAFVRMDRAEDRNELGQVSDIDLLQLRSEYEQGRIKLYTSEGEARQTRLALALSLNRPGQQPSQLTPPELDVNGRSLQEYEEILDRILGKNPQLAALNYKIAAAKSRIEAARSSGKPKVTAMLERAEQTRTTATDDDWRVGMEMSVPLYDGGTTDAAVKKAHLDLNLLMYQRQQYELQLRAEVRQIAEQFRILKASRDASVAFNDYRELYMDRSRALYDLEVKTDLGDAMIQISEAHVRDAQQRFEMALLLAQLNLLAGEPVMDWDAFTTKDPAPEGGGV
jgi:outer membrane protein TolC